jgi:hypothetical protein
VKNTAGETLQTFNVNQTISIKGYEVTFMGVNIYPARPEDAALGDVFTFEIKKKETVVSTVKTGVIRGKVNIGPICPVEREGVPCPVPPEVYTSREIIIYKTDGTTEVARKAIGADGTYSFVLSAGSYILDLPHTGVGGSADVPHPFTLASGATGYYDLSIDTGIR